MREIRAVLVVFAAVSVRQSSSGQLGGGLDASSAALPAEAPRGLMEQPYYKQTAELA